MAVPSPQTAVLNPVVIIGSCCLGLLIGGLADGWILGHERGFGRFGALFGLSIGGFLGAAAVEFVQPLVFGMRALVLPAEAQAPPGPAAPQPAPGEGERLNLAGRLLRLTMVLGGLALGCGLLVFGTRPLADALGASVPLVAGPLLLLAGGLGTGAAVLGGALARDLDLTTG